MHSISMNTVHTRLDQVCSHCQRRIVVAERAMVMPTQNDVRSVAMMLREAAGHTEMPSPDVK